MKIKKTDINSIFPIIIKIIKLVFEDVSKLAKLKFCKLYISEFTVLVKVKIESLKDLSNPILSITNKLDKINKLRKNEINIRKEIFVFSSEILFSELNMVLFIILFGLINFIISEEVIFNKIYNLASFIPEVLDIKEPPITVIKRKYKLKLLSPFNSVIPELAKLLKTATMMFRISELSKKTNKTKIKDSINK